MLCKKPQTLEDSKYTLW